ncbi:MAG: DUF2809 domain-containing protein [Verrucomicrobiales bacterium]
MRPARRSRIAIAAALALTIAAGLGSRTAWAQAHLPEFVADYAGDTLWTVAAFFALAFVFPKAKPCLLFGAALGLSFAVEFSQLYRAGWLDSIRANRIGALLLGRGFLWSDLICYTAGALIATAIDRLTLARR